MITHFQLTVPMIPYILLNSSKFSYDPIRRKKYSYT